MSIENSKKDSASFFLVCHYYIPLETCDKNYNQVGCVKNKYKKKKIGKHDGKRQGENTVSSK